jgi:hypothetical protein
MRSLRVKTREGFDGGFLKKTVVRIDGRGSVRSQSSPNTTNPKNQSFSTSIGKHYSETHDKPEKFCPIHVLVSSNHKTCRTIHKCRRGFLL